MAQTPTTLRPTALRQEVRTFLIVSAGAFALGLVIGFLLMGQH